MPFVEWISSNQFVFMTIAVYTILGFSIQAPMRGGALSLAGIGFYLVGSYTAGYLAKEGQSTALAIAAGIAISGACGWVLAVVLVRLRALYLAMATLAFTLMVGVVALNWVSVTGGPVGLYGLPIRISLAEVLIALAFVMVLMVLLERGIMGRTFDVIREDESLAQTLAVDTVAYRRFVFVISSVLGGLAGTLHGLTSYAISPADASFGLIILVLAMVIIGGRTSWVGALIGVAALTWIPLQLSGIGQWWPVVYGAGLIVVAVYVPGGLLSLISLSVSRVRLLARQRRGGQMRQPRRTTDMGVK